MNLMKNVSLRFFFFFFFFFFSSSFFPFFSPSFLFLSLLFTLSPPFPSPFQVDKARNAYFTRAFDRGEDLHPYDLLLRLGAKEGEEEGEKKRGELGVSVNDFVEHFRKVYVVDVSNKLLSAPEYKGLTSFVEKRMEEKMTKLFG